MSSAVNPVSTPTNTNASSSNTATTAAINATDSLGNEDTFLQLLVAQIQNQDPTNPVDSNTFLTQLAEFSQLEQLIGIRQGVSELDPTTGSTTAGTTPTDGTTPTQN
jgi:flagellar basal-body rod modification protein FlgD